MKGRMYGRLDNRRGKSGGGDVKVVVEAGEQMRVGNTWGPGGDQTGIKPRGGKRGGMRCGKAGGGGRGWRKGGGREEAWGSGSVGVQDEGSRERGFPDWVC